MQMANSEWRLAKNAAASAERTLESLYVIRHSPSLFSVSYSPLAGAAHG
jgi:hypothetical protein